MRRRWIILGIFLLSLATVIVIVRGRKQDNPPEVIFGPHQTKLRYISFSEAHAKPWFDFNLPLIGRVTLPKRTSLPGVDPKDDPRFIAGYIIGDEEVTWNSFAGGQVPIRYAMPAATPSAIAVGYPADAFFTKGTLSTIGPRSEQVQVTVDFQFDRLPARLSGQEIRIGNMVLKPRIILADRDQAWIRLQIDCAKNGGSVAISTNGMLEERPVGSAVFTVIGGIQRDDSVVIEGDLGYRRKNGAELPLRPFRIVLRPKPLNLLR